MAAVVRSENPSTLDEGYPDNLGDIHNFQEVDNTDKEENTYVKGVNTTKMAARSDFQEYNEKQLRDTTLLLARLQLIEVAKGKSIEGVIDSDSSNLNQAMGMAGSNITKSTLTRINRKDFGLKRISKALMLPTHGKRSTTFDMEEGKAEGYDISMVLCGKVGEHF